MGHSKKDRSTSRPPKEGEENEGFEVQIGGAGLRGRSPAPGNSWLLDDEEPEEPTVELYSDTVEELENLSSEQIQHLYDKMKAEEEKKGGSFRVATPISSSRHEKDARDVFHQAIPPSVDASGLDQMWSRDLQMASGQDEDAKPFIPVPRFSEASKGKSRRKTQPEEPPSTAGDDPQTHSLSDLFPPRTPNNTPANPGPVESSQASSHPGARSISVSEGDSLSFEEVSEAVEASLKQVDQDIEKEFADIQSSFQSRGLTWHTSPFDGQPTREWETSEASETSETTEWNVRETSAWTEKPTTQWQREELPSMVDDPDVFSSAEEPSRSSMTPHDASHHSIQGNKGIIPYPPRPAGMFSDDEHSNPFLESPTIPYSSPNADVPKTPPQNSRALVPSPPRPDVQGELAKTWHYLDLQKASTMAIQPHQIDPHLLVLHEPEGEVASRYRLLDFKLRRLGEERPVRTVAFTSPTEGAGTSLTALNLALVRAESPHMRVAVVDLNFRRPSISRLIGLDSGPSLPNLLRGEASLEEIVVRLDESQCYILPASQIEGSPSKLYKSAELTHLFEQLYDLFDLVVMDLPAIIPKADINQVNALIDAIVMVVASGKTLGPDVKKASQMIDHEKIIGAVLNEA